MRNDYPGKFIVIYGVNNLGKTTQANMLVQKLKASGLKAEYLKYPIYDLLGIKKSQKILCLFGHEKNPSMSVSLGFGHCFSCGKSMGSIGYLMNFKGLRFSEAVRELCKKI